MKATLDEIDVGNDPVGFFKKWFEEALKSEVLEPNAMSLATADADGRPSVRVVLLKNVEDDSFVFFTNYQSRKGRDIEANPHAAMCFNWLELERQVRIEGKVEKIPAEESEAYFNSRPRMSRIGALVSDQSRPVESREFLEKKFRELNDRYDGQEIPIPPYWGGYRLVPERIEFWQGRRSRLHDRLEFSHNETEEWKIRRLAP